MNKFCLLSIKIVSLLIGTGWFHNSYAEQHLLVGKIDFRKHNYIYSHLEGVVSGIYVKSGTQVNEKQPIVSVTPFDPNKESQRYDNQAQESIVSEVLIRVGEKVEQYQPLIRLNQKSEMFVRAIAYFPSANYINIGQAVEVILGPDEDKFQMSGAVEAIHNRETQLGQLSQKEIEINIDIDSCAANSVCKTYLSTGHLVSVKFATSQGSKESELNLTKADLSDNNSSI